MILNYALMYVCMCRLPSRGAFRLSRPDSGSSISLLHVGSLLRETGEHWNAPIRIHIRPHLYTYMKACINPVYTFIVSTWLLSQSTYMYTHIYTYIHTLMSSGFRAIWNCRLFWREPHAHRILLSRWKTVWIFNSILCMRNVMYVCMYVCAEYKKCG